MVGWTREYQLLDMKDQPNKIFGFHCRKCCSYQGLKVSDLLTKFDDQYFFNEIERDMRCHHSHCLGPVRIERQNSEFNEAFQGGLP